MIRALLAAALWTIIALPAWASDDLIADGKKVFKKCAACHSVGEGAKNKIGPQLNGITTRTAGSVEGYKYSPVYIAFGEAGLVWEEPALSAYLADPKGWLKDQAAELGLNCDDLKKCRNKMAFAGLKKEKDFAAIAAYLASFDEAGAAVAPTN